LGKNRFAGLPSSWQ
ncbi:alpha amylase, catalytic domain protein, partial [Vibrio parahaemolyticus 861]